MYTHTHNKLLLLLLLPCASVRQLLREDHAPGSEKARSAIWLMESGHSYSYNFFSDYSNACPHAKTTTTTTRKLLPKEKKKKKKKKKTLLSRRSLSSRSRIRAPFKTCVPIPLRMNWFSNVARVRFSCNFIFIQKRENKRERERERQPEIN